jgi:hypothetical protein
MALQQLKRVNPEILTLRSLTPKQWMICNYHLRFNGKSRFGLKGSAKALWTSPDLADTETQSKEREKP